MKKKHLVGGLALLGAGAAAAAAVVAAKKLAQNASEPEDSILLDLDGDGVADVVLEDLDGDGKIDTVTAGIQPTEEAETPAEEPKPEEAEAPAEEAVTTENPDLITTVPAVESLTRDFSVRKRCKTAGILCVFQGFTADLCGKRTVKARRRNCAALPYMFFPALPQNQWSQDIRITGTTQTPAHRMKMGVKLLPAAEAEIFPNSTEEIAMEIITRP